jgi:hypothetical protein
MPWVDLAGSLQWKSFQRLVELLEKRAIRSLCSSVRSTSTS